MCAGHGLHSMLGVVREVPRGAATGAALLPACDAPSWPSARTAELQKLRDALDASTGTLIPVAGAVACVASARREASATQATLALAHF